MRWKRNVRRKQERKIAETYKITISHEVIDVVLSTQFELFVDLKYLEAYHQVLEGFDQMMYIALDHDKGGVSSGELEIKIGH